MTALADHLWQSSLFALAAGLLTLTLRNNAAAIRFWLWFAASIKFLVPFALLAALGEMLARLAPIPSLPVSPALRALAAPAEKLSAPALTPVPGENLVWPLLLVWLAGLTMMTAVRLSRWWSLRALVRGAHALPLSAPVEVRACPSLLEPGLVGVLRPIVLLPKGLLGMLSAAERDGILAHEVTHWRRRDNLTAALHMAVEALFWFWPPVWLIGSRMVAERERACDEGVIAAGHDPESYAASILKVCRFCIQTPLACAAGVSGADLNARIRQIMTDHETARLDGARRALLVGAGLAALGLPILAGVMTTPLAVTVTRQVAAVQARAEEAAATVAEQFGMAPIVTVSPPAKPRQQPRASVAAAAPPTPIEPAQAAEPAAAPAPAPAPAAPPPPVQLAAATAPSLPATEVARALYPRGEGDPDAVTCRVPKPLPASRFAGPEVCQTNRVWAALYREGRSLAPDGRTLVATNVRYGQEGRACPPALIFSSPGLAVAGSMLSACR